MMIKRKVLASKCSGCAHHLYYSEREPKKEKGKTLRFGYRYCTASKHIREFGKQDPKQRVPKWCPKRITPALLRIYCYRNSEKSFLRQLLKKEHGNIPLILKSDYAMRFEGPTLLTARSFQQQVKSVSLTELLAQHVRVYEIIEIDDGVSSYCFFVGDRWRITCIHFDAALARENELEQAIALTEEDDKVEQ